MRLAGCASRSVVWAKGREQQADTFPSARHAFFFSLTDLVTIVGPRGSSPWALFCLFPWRSRGGLLPSVPLVPFLVPLVWTREEVREVRKAGRLGTLSYLLHAAISERDGEIDLQSL